MKRFILIGPSGCGKTTLCQALYDLPKAYRKTQMVEVVADVIDTPGEYMENRRLYRALAVSAADAQAVFLVQEHGGRQSFPPGFAAMFDGKPVYGIVSKTDRLDDEERTAVCRELLAAGVGQVFFVSALREDGIAALKSFLCQHSDKT